MPQKRSKFLTIVFSCLPGAGHMFMGFMKMGLSLMGMFFLIIFLSSLLNFGALMYIIPILCFYSFFDCISKCYASDNEFARFQDHYLFSLDKLSNADNLLHGKGRLIIGIITLLIGIKLIWDVFIDVLSQYIPEEIYMAIRGVTTSLPQFVIGFLIIAIGVYLIIGKKRSNDNNA
jgi:hypothetical protein